MTELAKDPKIENTVVTKPTFTKEQILQSKKVIHSKDILNIVLECDKKYSLEEVDDLVKKFKKRKVK